MSRNIITLVLALCLAGSAVGQPRISGVHRMGRGFLIDVYATADGGFVTCGISLDSAWHSSSWIIKTTSHFLPEWEQTYEGGYPYTIIETDDGGFLIGGNGGFSDNGFAVFRTDENGNLLWRNAFADGRCDAVLELKDGNYLLIGGKWLGNRGIGYLVMTNPEGAVIWTRMYEPWRNCHSFLRCGRETGGGVVAVGAAQFIDGNGMLGWAIKVGFDGNLLWMSDTVSSIYPKSMVSSPEGGFQIAGWVDHSNLEVRSLSDDGEWQWSQRIRDEEGGACGEIARWQNDGTVLSHGRSVSRLSNQGDVRWDAHIQVGNYENSLRSVIFGRDGSIVACGQTIDTTNDAVESFGVLIQIEPEVPGPTIGFRRPDSISIDALPEDRLNFEIRATNQWGEEVTYSWFYNDSLIANDSITTVTFHQRGQTAIAGRAYSGGDSAEAVWQVDVVDLYIVAQNPNTPNLSVRRMSSVDFSIDSVRAVGGIENVDFQWFKTNLDNQEQNDAGQDSHALIEFPEVGSFRVEGQAYRGASIDHVFWNVQVRAGVLGIGAATVESEPGRIARVPIAVFNDGQDTLHWQADAKTIGEAGSELGMLRHTIAVGQIVNDDRIEGAIFDGESYFCAGSNGDNSNTIYHLNRQGELLGSFPQSGHSRYGFKDLEWDGELIWGSGEDSVFAITRDGEVAYRWRGPFNPTANIAYDPDENVLWLSSTVSNIVAYDREGNALGTTINRQGLRHYGLAWYADDPDSAFLYDLNLPGGDLPPQISKFNPATGEMSLVTTLPLDSANSLNGAFICRNYDKYQGFVMLSVANIPMANGGDELQVWQLQPNTEWLTVNPDSGEIPAGQSAEVEIRVRTAGWDGSWAFEVGEYEGEIVFSHDGQGGQDVLPVHLRVVEPNEVSSNGQERPSSFTLFPAYPNPFNATTRISYSLPRSGLVSLNLYNLTGREVAKLVDGTVPAGTYSSEVNLANLPSGLYILRLRYAGEVRTAKLILVK